MGGGTIVNWLIYELTCPLYIIRHDTGSTPIMKLLTPWFWYTGSEQWKCYFYLRIENVERYVLIAVYLFIYLFVCVLFANLKKY